MLGNLQNLVDGKNPREKEFYSKQFSAISNSKAFGEVLYSIYEKESVTLKRDTLFRAISEEVYRGILEGMDDSPKDSKKELVNGDKDFLFYALMGALKHSDSIDNKTIKVIKPNRECSFESDGEEIKVSLVVHRKPLSIKESPNELPSYIQSVSEQFEVRGSDVIMKLPNQISIQEVGLQYSIKFTKPRASKKGGK